MSIRFAGAIAAALVLAAPAFATPRDTLTQAAFQTTDKEAALRLVNQAIATTEAQLAAEPNNREALIQHAAGIGYRAKLTHSAGDAKTAHRLVQALVDNDPRDPEAQLMLAGWNLDSVADLGAFVASVGLGAKPGAGLAALDRAVALGRGRAFFSGIAAMMRIRLDAKDVAAATRLAQAAAAGSTPTPLDRIAKAGAAQLLGPLRAGDGKAAAALARQLLPFGRLGKQA